MVNTKGFTLIELIIVIAIIAILATTVILVLNPVNILAEARDSQRIADLGQMNSAFGLYLATVASPGLGVATSCYTHAASVGLLCGGRHVGATVISADRRIDGNGWIPVNLGATSGGSALSVLPIDPTNTTSYYYSYANGTTTYEFNAKMESARYRCGGNSDMERTDGGNRPATAATACNATQPSQDEVYELGNDPGLDI